MSSFDANDNNFIQGFLCIPQPTVIEYAGYVCNVRHDIKKIHDHVDLDKVKDLIENECDTLRIVERDIKLDKYTYKESGWF